MAPVETFIAKWKNGGDERRDAQPFFEDLCRLVGHETPREADPGHTWFMYEAGADKTSGGKGWADVWKKGFFGWEAKGTDRSLEKAYEQLKMYADALQNPPLLVVTDLQTIVVHTNFTNSVKATHKFTVDELDQPENMRVLRAVFFDPESLKPGQTRAAVTTDAAKKFTKLAIELSDKGHDTHAVAHFLNRLIFCMFAEDIGLLPKDLFTKMVKSSLKAPHLFEQRSSELFKAMSTGGSVNYEEVKWFNGGLFEDGATLPLDAKQLELLSEACALEWDEIEPSIFGTLFERGLDPSKRSQLGAHYTDPATIMKIVGPVVIEPWLRAWEIEKAALITQMAKAKKTISAAGKRRFNIFLEKLRAFTVLDPACGSGNFLYLALRSLKDIEKQILIEAEGLGLVGQFPAIGPKNVKGIELNDYAAELARITIWIGEIQWMIRKGYGARLNPILQPLDQIETRDALLNPDGTEASWPSADAIVGNPPFLGGSKLLGELGDDYVSTLRNAYRGRVPGGADLVCYWFEKSNDALKRATTSRAGLVSTNSIRGGTNREVLKHIIDGGRIFNAWSDEEWFNDGAAVRVSLIAFERGDAGPAFLDGSETALIHADLTPESQANGVDLTKAKKLPSNANVAFSGTKKGGKFDIEGELGRQWMAQANPNGKPNSDVVRPWVNGSWIVRRPHGTWIIDFGTDMSERDASMYEAPFEWVKERVLPVRELNRRATRKEYWWLHSEVCVGMRRALDGLPRYIATPRISKHRIFEWLHPAYLIDDGVYCFAKDDDTTFGILHSYFHELWSLKMCTYLGVGNDPRYTPTSCFDTFPFPDGLTPDVAPSAYIDNPRAKKIAGRIQL